MIIVDHCEMIYPHYGPQSLNPRRRLILHEILNEQAFSLRLDELVMAFS